MMKLSIMRLYTRLITVCASLTLGLYSYVEQVNNNFGGVHQSNEDGVTYVQRTLTNATLTYDLPNPDGTCQKQILDFDSPRRRDRFPSIEERICYLMTIWYDPHFNTEKEWKSPFFFFYLNEPESRFKRLFASWNGTGIVLRNAIGPDYPFHILMSELDVLQDLATYGKQKGWWYSLLDDVSGRIELRENLFSYGQDMMEFIRLFQAKGLFPPLLAQFGDHELSMDFPMPTFSKWRYIDPTHARKPLPIITKLESERHYDTPFPVVLREDIPWEQKRNRAVYRGMMSGHNVEDDWIAEDYLRSSNFTLREACRKIQRCRLVYQNHKTPNVDAKLTYVFRKFDSIDNIPMIAPHLGIAGQCQYKMIISLEGNDVATGLKWNLLSNSVVLMPPPLKTTWAMEEYLVPWVHYVPLSRDLGDVEEKVAWVLEHDGEAKRISQRATTFINDLFLSEEAKRDNREVLEQVALRYARLWGQ